MPHARDGQGGILRSREADRRRTSPTAGAGTMARVRAELAALLERCPELRIEILDRSYLRSRECSCPRHQPPRSTAPATAPPPCFRMTPSGQQVVGREQQHVRDRLRADEQHEEPVEADRDAPGVGHAPERLEEALVEGWDAPREPPPLLLLIDEPPPLLDGVGQLGEAVRELEPAGVELEALREAGVVRA